MQSNYHLPLADKLVWSAGCIGILVASPFLCIAELMWSKENAKSIFQAYDKEVVSMWATLKSMWIDDDDFDYGAYA